MFREIPLAAWTYCGLVRAVADRIEELVENLRSASDRRDGGSQFEMLTVGVLDSILSIRGYTDDYEGTFPWQAPAIRAPEADSVGQRADRSPSGGGE